MKIEVNSGGLQLKVFQIWHMSVIIFQHSYSYIVAINPIFESDTLHMNVKYKEEGIAICLIFF